MKHEKRMRQLLQNESGSFYFFLHFWCRKEVLETRKIKTFFSVWTNVSLRPFLFCSPFFISHENSNGFLIEKKEGSAGGRETIKSKTIRNLALASRQSVSDKDTTFSQRAHKRCGCVFARGSGSAAGEITIIVSQYFTLTYMLKLNYLSVTKSPTLFSLCLVTSSLRQMEW